MLLCVDVLRPNEKRAGAVPCTTERKMRQKDGAARQNQFFKKEKKKSTSDSRHFHEGFSPIIYGQK